MSKAKKIEMTIPEAMQLTQELNGIPSQDGKSILVKGMFAQKLTMASKFDLKILFNKCSDLIKVSDEVRNDFIKEHGEADEAGNFQIKQKITKKVKGEEQEIENPKFAEYVKMYEELMSKKYEIELKQLEPADFSFEAEEVYPMFMEVLERLAK